MPNALARETSPYLLQHRDNPVDWQPWGEEAFERAAREDKPVFLSVGYSTCHWCHVMERESFENEEIAAVMNENFVCVKVDREERPDLDATYMAFVQATTGQGGWPMSVWLTPAGKPVVGGTYFPPDDRHGRAGFPKLCAELGRLWREDRERMEESAAKVMEHLRQSTGDVGAVVQGLPGEPVFGDFIDRCENTFDPEWGGWGGAPKFPRPVVPRLLLQLSDRFGAETDEGGACLQMVERTLKTMAAGGIHDQLGGGFHRYSVDRYWHVPHYEKMLYDQAQLAMLYLDGWQATGEARFRDVAEGVLDYVVRDLSDPAGGFHAAEDADSLPEHGAAEKREGAYWTWTAAEIFRRLEPGAAAWFCAAHGVAEEGNARPESDPHGELAGQNTLFRAESEAALAERLGCDPETLRESLAASREILLEARGERPAPHRDDKIIASWNGMMIGALARGARVLDRDDFGEAARRAAAFLREHLWDGTELRRSWRGEAGKSAGFAGDYAAVIAGLIELHGLDGEREWLDWAVELQARLDAHCWDADHGGYVMRPRLGGETLMTIHETYDGAEPAATHVAARNLLDLQAHGRGEDFGGRAEAILRAGARRMDKQGFVCPVLLGAYDAMTRGVVRMDVRGELPEAIATRARETFLPLAVWTKSNGPGEVIACRDERCEPWE